MTIVGQELLEAHYGIVDLARGNGTSMAITPEYLGNK